MNCKKDALVTKQTRVALSISISCIALSSRKKDPKHLKFLKNENINTMNLVWDVIEMCPTYFSQKFCKTAEVGHAMAVECFPDKTL